MSKSIIEIQQQGEMTRRGCSRCKPGGDFGPPQPNGLTFDVPVPLEQRITAYKEK